MTAQRMPYRQYKASYPDCQTVPGTYDKASRTIEIIIPDGRMKASGTRGKTYRWLHFDGVEIATGRKVTITIKATCLENAVKRLPADCTWEIQ